jgi:hypothetical protein
MATEPDLGSAQGYLTARTLMARTLMTRTFDGPPPHSALNRMHATSRSRHGRRDPLPGVRRVLLVLVELATVHDRGRRRARPDPGQIRQRKIVGHALRRRSMLGAVRQGRCCDVMRDLCGAAGSLPHLHARRSRMRHGAAQARAAAIQNRLNSGASGTPDSRWNPVLMRRRCPQRWQIRSSSESLKYREFPRPLLRA